jgi:hypothetical protein
MNDKTLKARVSILSPEPGFTANEFRSYMVEAVVEIQNEIAGRPVAVEIHVLVPAVLIAALGKRTIEEAVTNARALCPDILGIMLVPVDTPLTADQIVDYAASATSKLSAKIEAAISSVGAGPTLH